MVAWPHRERRRYRRLPVKMVLETEIGEERRRQRMETFNMSAGGFSCRLDRPIQPLTLLQLSLRFPAFGARQPEPQEIDCTAVVVRCDPWRRTKGGGYEVAAAFTWIRPQDRRLLCEYLDWYDTVYLGDEKSRAGGRLRTG